MHEDIYIGYSKFFNNSGIYGSSQAPSGNGIVLSDVTRATVEHTSAYNNGWNCNSFAGGPVGIWAWHADHVTFQWQ